MSGPIVMQNLKKSKLWNAIEYGVESRGVVHFKFEYPTILHEQQTLRDRNP